MLWVCVAVTVVAAGLLAVLASARPASQVVTRSPLLGKAAPPLSGPAVLNGPPGGGPVTLSAYRGRWVLVNFAASWCVPCQQEMPQLLLFSAQHRSKGNVVILTVAYDQTDLGHLRRFLQARQVTWPVVDESQAKVDWGVALIPESYLIDPQGTVVAKVPNQVVAADLDALIKRLSPATSSAVGP